MSLARLAGATRSSPPFSNSTLLLSGSSKSALGTLVWKVSSFRTVMFEAACARTIAAARIATVKHVLGTTSRMVRNFISPQIFALSDWHAPSRRAIGRAQGRTMRPIRSSNPGDEFVEPASVEELLGARGRAERRYE